MSPLNRSRSGRIDSAPRAESHGPANSDTYAPSAFAAGPDSGRGKEPDSSGFLTVNREFRADAYFQLLLAPRCLGGRLFPAGLELSMSRETGKREREWIL